MKIYLSGPLFTQIQRRWNRLLAAGLEDRIAGAEVILPQDFKFGQSYNDPQDFPSIFRACIESLREAGIDPVIYDGVRVEPTDESFSDAIDFAANGQFDGYVAVGGGSSIDTAKAANLYATYPAELLAYVNQPLGEGRQVPGPVRPLIAIPTTAGTGSETTGTAIFDMLSIHTKTGIAHRALRPALGIVDPDNTRSLPPMVAAGSGLLTGGIASSDARSSSIARE